MSGFRSDLRQAARSLARAPGFAALAVGTLALGIGGAVTLFSAVRAVLLDDLPYPEVDRLVVVWEADRLRGTTREWASAPDYSDFLERSRSFERLGARTPVNKTLGGQGEALRVSVQRVTASYFPLLRVEPLAGRSFREEEQQPGRDHVALLSESLWRNRFGADAGILGRTIHLDQQPVTIVGVMPRRASLPFSDEDLWQPLALGPGEQYRGMHNLFTMGRLRDGVSLQDAQREMAAIMAALEEEYPGDNRGRSVELVPLQEQVVGEVRPGLLVLLGAVLMVLLVTCANVANLLLARGVTRVRELAVRTSLGASPWRLARMVLAESAALALSGGALGTLLAFGANRLLVTFGPAGIPRLSESRIDSLVLAVALALTLCTGLLFGAMPAWRSARAHPATGLREAGDRQATPTGYARRLLVVAEVALACLLVLGSGLLIRSLWLLQRVETGYQPDRLLLVDMQLAGPRYPFPEGWPVHDWPEGRAFCDELLARARGLPGVAAASLAHSGPHDAGWTTRVTVEGAPPPEPGSEDEARFRPVAESYFETVGAPILAGRSFTRFDSSRAPLVAVVNESFVRRHFPDDPVPVGRGIVVFGAPREVVGIVKDVRFAGLERDAQPAMYLPLAQNPLNLLTLVVRAARDPEALIASVRSLVAGVDPELAAFNVQTARSALAGSLAPRRFNAWLLAGFAGLALTLAIVGVYGVLSYAVSQRTREMGVRLALGADPGQLVRLVVGDGMRLVTLALVLGIVSALGLGRLLESLLFGVTARDPVTFAGVAGALVLTALAACYLPARRATRIDATSALRGE